MTEKYAPCSCGSGKKFKFCCFLAGKALDTADPHALLRRAVDFPIHECVVNADWKARGLASVGVVREMPNLKYLMGVYLVDTYCLGVKDAFSQVNIRASRIAEFKSRSNLRFEPIPYEDARSLVLGAIEYARELGFEPHPDWAEARYLVEPERSFMRRFEFGHEGKPLYIQGPHDDGDSIMRRLGGAVETGAAHFIRELRRGESGPDVARAASRF